MSETLFREARMTDAKAMADILVRSIREICGPAYGNDKRTIGLWCADKTPATMVRMIADHGYYSIVAETSGAISGLGVLDKSGEIVLCYVIPEVLYQGVGKGILQALEKKARSLRLKELKLKSTLNAIPFYARNGYRPHGDYEMFLGKIPCLPLTKDISRRRRFGMPGR